MTDLSATLLWVQVGGLLWLALVLQLFYRRVHRERFLRYWALSFAVLGGALALQLALRPISSELIKSHIPYMLGNLQFPLIALAALSLKPPAPSPRQRMLVLAGFLAGLLILFAVTVGLAADQSALTQSLRFERQVLGAATTAWFSLAFWRSPYFARAMGGRVAAVFIALYAVYYAVHAVFAWGIPPYLVGNPVLLRVIAAVLPLGVATGMIVLATQAMIATTKSLRDSEERYRTLVEASPDGIVATDLSGKIFMCNRRAAELHGYASAAELNGTWAPPLIAPADRERIRAAAMMTIEEDRTTRVECQVLLSGGSERSAEVTGAPWRASDGSIAGTVAILHDITERKEADRALRREREFSAHVIDAIPGIFFVQDRQTKAVRWNRNLEDLTGLPPERIYLDDPLNRFHPEDRPRVADAVAGAFASGSAEFEARALLGPSQELRHFHLTARRMELDGVDYLVGCGLDITQRKRAEEDKARLQAQLHHAQKMESIGRLAGGVAHDFNNLLTVILGYSELLLSELSAGAPLRDTVAQIHKAGERAAGLTRQLLAFSRKQVLEPRVLDLNRVVKEMRPMLERLVGEDVKVRAALHAESGTVSADPHQLEQVLMNLAANARDAMPGGGELVIETAQVERHVMLAVSDNGVGMDEATRRQIFEPFFTTKEVGKGTGLGLSMVQGIVAQSGGYIVVHSEPGQGTSFKIYLPALAGAAGPADVPAQREAERPARILVADDEPGVRSFLRKALEADGNEVIEAADGKQALEEALARQVDLVITDLVMPEQEGIETVRALRQDMPGVGIIAISGAFDGQFLKTAQMLGADAVLAKPVSAELLLAKVSEVLKWRR